MPRTISDRTMKGLVSIFVLTLTVKKVMDDSGLEFSDLSAIAVSIGPGQPSILYSMIKKAQDLGK